MASSQTQESVMDHLPKEILEMVFLNLPVPNIHTAMRVCKQWNSIFDKNFWRKYVSSHFDLEENPLDEGSALHEWKVQDGLCNCGEDKLTESERWGMEYALKKKNKDRYFTHYPQRLKCDVIVPYRFKTDNITDYHQFAVVFEKATLLKRAIKLRGTEWEENGFHGTIDVVVFDWSKEDMPDNEEILEMFHSEYYEVGDPENNDFISGEQYSTIFDPHVSEDEDESDDSQNETGQSQDEEGVSTSTKQDVKTKKESLEYKMLSLLNMRFRPWIEKLFQPAVLYSFGEEVHSGGVNVMFLLTKLSKTHIGGVILPCHI